MWNFDTKSFLNLTEPNLEFKGTSVKMECCGNACGPDFSKEALKQRLTAQQYQVTQEKDTERFISFVTLKYFFFYVAHSEMIVFVWALV